METRQLICKLDEQELLTRGQQLAQAECDYAEIESAKKDANAAFKQSLEATQSRINQLSMAIRDREETRDVEVVVQSNNDTLKHEVVRIDTGEVVRIYDFTAEERQARLFNT